jgi:hypothetical protein
VTDLRSLVVRVAAALRETEITPEGPVEVPPAIVPADLGQRVPQSLRTLWERGASRLRWHDHAAQRLGRDARHGGIWLMSPQEARSEIRQYLDLIEDEREFAEPRHVELAEVTWGSWIPFHRFASGDCLAVEPAGEVVLWQHDLLDGGPYYHGLRLGASLDDFCSAWARVAFAEPRDWREVAIVGAPGLRLEAADWRVLL